MNISPINGYEIKHREAEKLNKDVEKFLKERELTVLPVAFKPKKLRTECKPFKPEVNWRYKPNKKPSNRIMIVEQSALIAKYISMTTTHKRWVRVLEKVDYVVNQNNLKNISSGEYAISDKNIWEKVKCAIEELIAEIENENKTN